MSKRPAHRRLHRAIRGFTLIEIMAVLVILGVLVMIAFPSFTNALRKSRRSDAVEAMVRVQQAQERWRSNNREYAGAAQLTPAWPAGLGLPSTSTSGFYTIATSVANASSNVAYTVTATAVSGRSQAADSVGSQSCSVLSMTVSGGVPTYAQPACWSR